MLADFALRLAVGLVACLLLLAPRSAARSLGPRPLVGANYFRTHLLIVLALSCGAMLWPSSSASGWLLFCLLAAAVLAFLGSVVWSLEGSPGAVPLLLLTLGSLVAALLLREGAELRTAAGAFASALLLGTALSAMLMGHHYLIAPTMSLTPLFRLMAALAVALTLRAVLDGYALAQWTEGQSVATLKGDAALWLPVRWLVGIIAPGVLCGMAWQTARIRSTQSATGILYVVVVCCFLGELTGLLLRPAGLTL